MKRPDLPADHCANQPPETARKMFVQSIAPRLKGGSMDARSAISELEKWREYHPEVFADWEGLCWQYLQQPPEWVDWLIQGVRVTSGKVTKADDLVAAAQTAAVQQITQPLAQHGEIGNGRADESRGSDRTSTRGETQAYLLKRLARDAPGVLERVKSGEIKSARAAAIEAGIITPFPSIALKDPAPTAQKLLAKKGQAWCLQLLEELSELVL
jgi:hypothetical protein